MPASSHRPRRRAATLLAATVGAVAVLAGAGLAGASAPTWHVARINAPAIAPGIVVAVVDTGVDRNHPVFGNRLLPQLNFIDEVAGDDNGHGTHVAGTVAGADAGCGAIGVVPDARILPVRVLADEDGTLGGNATGSTRGVVEGIRAAADAGAHIINLSLGGQFGVVTNQLDGGGAIRDAIEYAWSKGSIPVIAAGNDALLGALGSGYGNLDAVVVTATDNQDRLASYAVATGSAKWAVAAPGGDSSGGELQRDEAILSAWPAGSCALLIGTSMATPHVAGTLAAIRATGLGQQAAVDRLLATAREIGPSSTYGAGLVDVAAARGAAPPTTTAPTTAAPTTAGGPTTTSPGTTAQPTTATASSPSTTAASGGGAAIPTSSTTTAVDAPTSDSDGSTPTTSPGATVPADDLAADVVVTDEDDDPPGWLAPAAGAMILAAGGAAFVLRRRSV